MKSVQKIFLFFSLVILFLVFKTPAFAQTTNTAVTQPTNPYVAPNTNSDVPNNLHTWTQNVMIEAMSAMACQLTGVDITTADHRCLGLDTKTGKIGYVNGGGGVLGFTTNMIVALYTPPVRTGDFVNYLAGNFGITKPAVAATTPAIGLGFKALSPLTGLWIVFRNLVYILFVIVFLVIGIAIMFRVKIDPRTVMTIQNQIPKIIVGIILVTFSFAIAGFLIDLMYVVSYLMVGLIASADPSFSKELVTQLVGSTNPFNALGTVASHENGSILQNGVGDIAGGAAGAIGGHLGDLFNNDLGRAITAIVGGVIGSVLVGSTSILGFSVGILGAVVGAIAGPMIIGSILSMVGFLIIAISIIAALFRLWFQLIMAYISILIDVIFAPLWIVAGLIPGSKINVSAWIRNLLANLSAFPVVLVMFALARVFMDAFPSGNPENSLVPPLIGNPATPSQIGALIALGFILMTPSVVKLMKTMFGAPASGFGPIMEGITGGVGIGAALGRPIAQRLYHVNPRTGETEGALKNFGTSAFGRAKNSPLGRMGGAISRSPLGRVSGALARPFRSPNTNAVQARQRRAAAAMMRGARRGGGGTPPVPPVPPAGPPPSPAGPPPGVGPFTP